MFLFKLSKLSCIFYIVINGDWSKPICVINLIHFLNYFVSLVYIKSKLQGYSLTFCILVCYFLLMGKSQNKTYFSGAPVWSVCSDHRQASLQAAAPSLEGWAWIQSINWSASPLFGWSTIMWIMSSSAWGSAVLVSSTVLSTFKVGWPKKNN